MLSKKERQENKELSKRLKRSKPKDLDSVVHELHENAFDHIDCLECANCCKTTSPIIRERDLDRMSKHLRIKPSDLIDKYLELDEDQDYVFRSAPCPFLGPDNYCSIYSARPQACREYPHTDRKKFYQILDLSVKNTEICPAVEEIFENLKKHYKA